MSESNGSKSTGSSSKRTITIAVILAVVIIISGSVAYIELGRKSTDHKNTAPSPTTPSASMSVSEIAPGTNQATYTISITSVSGNISLSDVELIISNNTVTATSSPLDANSTITLGTTTYTLSVSGGSYLSYNTMITLTWSSTTSASGAGTGSSLTSLILEDTITGGMISTATNL